MNYLAITAKHNLSAPWRDPRGAGAPPSAASPSRIPAPPHVAPGGAADHTYETPYGVIVTEHWRKPIPTDRFDWCAGLDDNEGEGPHGFGATEREALTELLERLGEDDEP